MDAYPQGQSQGRDLHGPGQGQGLGQGSTLWQDEPLSNQPPQHTPRYRQSLSFQEGMRQDSVAGNASAKAEEANSKRDSLQQSYSFSSQGRQEQQQPGQRLDRSTGHVGITIDDHHGSDGLGRATHSHTQGGHRIAFEQGHSPVGSPSTAHSHTQHDILPPAVGQSARGSHHSNVYQQGYSQYHGHPPGAVLSRHLSIQLPPGAALLPPAPPPVAHSGSHAVHPPYSMDGSLDSTASHSREYTVPQSNATSNQSMGQWRSPQQGHSNQYLHQAHQQRQQHSPSQSVGVLPPPIKYIRSPLRSPNMPQISSQAMAYAQAQAQAQAAQSQYRHHSSYHHGAAQSQHQFPPRTHRRSIQPLTLDQQQPKGGSFRYVRNQADLWPQKGSQKYRSIDDYGHSISPLRALTALLTRTYSHCNQNFKYESSYNPRRVLTKPSKPVHNEGYDNEDYDYILYVSDILGSEERQRYLILDVLGQGTFGQVVKCQNLKTNAIVAVKVIKNRPAYFNQSMMEVTVLELLNERYDPEDRHHILRLHDTFIHRRHLCLVFELLSVNLYELIKQNQFRGLSMSLVRVLTAQLLDALCVLNEARIIHCDLKPENVLLKNLETPTIKVIDFGSACHEQQTVYTYIQSRFYRSPEVLVGLPYSSSIDIWSVGCIAAELFLGLPLFPGSSEYNQLSRIVEMLGMLPGHMLEIGKTAHEFFEVRPDHVSHGYNRSGPKSYRLKSIETYSRERKVMEQPSKRYFQATTLPDIINSYPLQKKGMTPKEIEKEMLNRLSFINFLQGLLNLNPIERWSPHQAKLHPFITGEPFTGNFVPPTIPKKPPTVENSIRLEPTMPGRSSKARSASLSGSSSTPVLSASSSANMGSEDLGQHAKVDSTLDSTHLQPFKPGTSPTETHTRSPLSALEDPLPPARGSVGGSPATPTSPLVNMDVSSSAVADGSGTSSVSNRNTGPQHSTGHQTHSFSGSTHHGHRPRATTMGTVEIPKNMVQLAAAMTPQGQASSGISGTSGLSHRMEPGDSTSEDILESSSPYQGNMGSYGSMGSSGHGLRQIPERSEQNSPVQEGSTGASSDPNSRSSTEEPSQHDQGQSSYQQQQSQQYSTRQYAQRPHRYLHRSGSDAGSMASAHTFRSSFGGGNTESLQTGGHGSGSNLVGSSSSVSGTSAAVPELTPLQKMQQQLNQSQGQQKQRQQQQYGYFGYSQSGSSPSEGSGSASGGDSNNSSRQDRLSEPDFEMDEGSLRQMDLGSGASRSNRSPLIYSTEADDLHESRSGIRSDSAGRSSLYGRSRGGASPYRGADGTDSPHLDSLVDNGSPARIDPQSVSMDTINLSGGFDSGLSNVEEEEEEEDEEDGEGEDEPGRVLEGDSVGASSRE